MPTKREWGFLVFILAALFIRGAQVALENSADFEVYWREVSGIQTAAPAGFVFKYPPWALPFFAPLAWLPLTLAKGVWFLISYGALLSMVRSLFRRGVRPRYLAVTLAGFWWILLGHFSMGQISLLLCAVLDFFLTRPFARTWGIASYLQSFKIFTLAFLLPAWVEQNRKTRWRWLGLSLGIFAVLSGCASLWQNQALFPLFQNWIHASASGADGLGIEVIRGQSNHGLNALILRAWEALFGTLPGGSLPETLLCLALIGGGWLGLRPRDARDWSWPVWVTLALPLAWHHSFVLAIPLCALALPSRLAWMGMVGIGLLIPQTLGNTPFLRTLELGGIKAGGALLLIYAYRTCKNQQ